MKTHLLCFRVHYWPQHWALHAAWKWSCWCLWVVDVLPSRSPLPITKDIILSSPSFFFPDRAQVTHLTYLPGGWRSQGLSFGFLWWKVGSASQGGEWAISIEEDTSPWWPNGWQLSPIRHEVTATDYKGFCCCSPWKQPPFDANGPALSPLDMGKWCWSSQTLPTYGQSSVPECQTFCIKMLTRK